MKRDDIIKKILPNSVEITPQGFPTLELSDKEIESKLGIFFAQILEIHKSDISEIDGYGEFDEDGILKYSSFKEFIVSTFLETNEGYWLNWKEMFETTVLDKEFFNDYYDKMINLSSYCEGKRYLVNNNTFFDYMITDGKDALGFPDWSRSGITDYLLDIFLMDLEKPHLLIMEKFYDYCILNSLDLENFKQRYLCMAYFKSLDTLRWHASIDDKESCEGIMKTMTELKARTERLN